MSVTAAAAARTLSEFVAALKPRTHRPETQVFSEFCGHWTRWQETVALPSLRLRAALHPRERDPAWARGDQLRLLASHKENEYSDWLSYLLAAPGEAGRRLQERLVTALCPEASPAPALDPRREVRTREGDEGQSGRLDIVLTNVDARRALVVEAKVRTPDPKELTKHRGYVPTFLEEHPAPPWHCDFLLLVPDVGAVRGMDTFGFTPVSWRSLTLAVRRAILARDLASDPWLESLAAVFTSAVEAHVLHLPVAAWRGLLEGSPLAHASVQRLADGAFADYLEECDGP